MTTRMIHPEHGATHAYDTGEVARLEMMGWSVEVQKKEPEPAPKEVEAHSLHPAPPVVPVRGKPGPKPKAK